MVIGLAVGGVALTWAVFAQIVAPPQTLSPGEVRLSSRPYVLKATLRAESRLVQLEVVVRDSHGRAVPGLTKDNFVLFDGSTKRELTAFSVDTSSAPVETPPHSASPATDKSTQPPAPTPVAQLPSQNLAFRRWIGLLFDDLNTAPGDLAHAKIAASRFIKEAVQSGDRIAVFTTSSGRASEFTDDSTAILVAVTKVQSHPRISPGGVAQCPRITAYEAYQIVKGDPSGMKAKVSEACTCSGGPPCFQKPVAELFGSVVELPQLEPFLKFNRFLDDILRRPDCLAAALEFFGGAGRRNMQSAAATIRRARHVYLTGIGSQLSASLKIPQESKYGSAKLRAVLAEQRVARRGRFNLPRRAGGWLRVTGL